MFRKKRINIFSSPVFLIFIGMVLLALILIPLSENIRKEYGVNKEIKQLEEEISSLQTRNGELKELLGYLESDQYIEAQAREKLNYKEEGEEVFVVPSTPGEEKNNLSNVRISAGSDASPAKGRYRNNIGNWWDYFFSTEKSS